MLTPNVNLSGKTVLITGAAGFIGPNRSVSTPREARTSTGRQDSKNLDFLSTSCCSILGALINIL